MAKILGVLKSAIFFWLLLIRVEGGYERNSLRTCIYVCFYIFLFLLFSFYIFLFLLFPKPQPNQACLFSPLRFCDYLPSYPRSLFQSEPTSGAWKNSFLPYNLQTHSDTLSSPHTAHVSFLPSKVLLLLLNWKQLGNSNPLQFSCLGNPMVRGTWQVTKSWTWLSD